MLSPVAFCLLVLLFLGFYFSPAFGTKLGGGLLVHTNLCPLGPFVLSSRESTSPSQSTWKEGARYSAMGAVLHPFILLLRHRVLFSSSPPCCERHQTGKGRRLRRVITPRKFRCDMIEKT